MWQFSPICSPLGLIVFVFSTALPPMPRSMIMGEDAYLDTVPRGSRIFNRVLNAVSTELQVEGFKSLQALMRCAPTGACATTSANTPQSETRLLIPPGRERGFLMPRCVTGRRCLRDDALA